MFDKKTACRWMCKMMQIMVCFIVLVSVMGSSCSSPMMHINDGFNQQDMHSCQEQVVTAAIDRFTELFNLIIGKSPIIELVALTILATLLPFRKPERDYKPPIQLKQRDDMLAWIWSKSRPFSKNKIHLPYFAPVRNA
ncbi:MAG: hypothetical protein O2877_00750 [bacterium]|nr:hypothetical protein [bacterium]